ncbi:MAG: class I SAM-dependent methyltransferase [Gaiellaceae bacterium]
MDSWLLDELALAGPEHLGPAAAVYEQKAGFDPEPDLALLHSLGLERGSCVVDLGAGTGVFAFAAARVAAHVVAVDVSPSMVAAMRSRNAGNVEVVNAGFLTYEHVGEPADFVYSRNALHHLPDFWKAIALTRVAALLRPGGVLRLRDLVYSFAPDEADEHIDAWLATGAKDPRAGWTRDELRAHVRDEHSTFAWILEGLLERAGFEIEAVRYDSRKVFGEYVAVKRR